jgi:hypothetical protein
VKDKLAGGNAVRPQAWLMRVPTESMKHPLFLLGLCFCLSTPQARAAIMNGSFEDGLIGWTTSFSGVTVHTATSGGDLAYPYPSSTIPSPYHAASGGIDGNGYATARFLWPEATGWVGPDGVQYTCSDFSAVSLAQTFYAEAGSVITGWANYTTRCYYTQTLHNPTWVSINGDAVWARSTLNVPLVEYPETRGVGWEQWSYSVPADGNYTISLGMGDGCQFGGSASFDGITISSVPDAGATGLLLGIGFAVVAAIRRRIA